jgi:hypothetical protein
MEWVRYEREAESKWLMGDRVGWLISKINAFESNPYNVVGGYGGVKKVGKKAIKKAPRGVLKRDLTKGPHAADRAHSRVIERARSTGKPQGQWNSPDAAREAASRARVGQKSVPLEPGAGTVTRVLPDGTVKVTPATRAVTVPKRAGDETVWHVYPAD